MDTNTIRFYLHDLNDMDKTIERLKNELHEYRNIEIDTIKVNVPSGLPATHNNESKVEVIVIKREEVISRIEGRIFELVILRSCIEESLQEVHEDTAIDYILQMRYFIKNDYNKKSLGQIAKEKNYEYGTLRNEDSNFMGKILKMFKKRGYKEITHSPKQV